jgi:hypothetical protein
MLNTSNFPAGIGAGQTIGGKTGVLIIGYNIPSYLTVFYTATDSSYVDISGSLTSGDLPFDVSNITQVAIGNTVTSIGDYAFRDTTALTTVTFEADSTLVTIGEWAFYNLPGSSLLTSIEIPKSVTSIGFNAFRNTTSLTEITFEAESTLTSIAVYAFYQSGLTSIVIPSSVTNISSDAFTSSGIENNTIYIEQPSSLAVSYNTPTTFFGATNVTIVRALSPPSGNGWYLFGSSGLPWSSSKISWGLNGYNIYQYIYDLSGSTWISDNWTAIDISGNDPVLPEYSAYWVKVIT